MPNGTVNGDPYTVPEGFEVVSTAAARRGRAAINLLNDLSRSPHGRHEGDVESQSPTGRSEGNPLLTTGQQIGYTINGRPLVVPEPSKRGDPEAWRA
jgi:hypothetical protein